MSVMAAWISAAFFVIIGIIITYEVIMRYIFLDPTSWVEESARILQVYAVFFACAWLVGTREHIRITVITGLLRPTIQLWLARFSLSLITLICGVGALYSAELMNFSISIGQRTDSTLELPMWLLQVPLVVGLALTALQAVSMFIESFYDRQRIMDPNPRLDL